MILIHWSEVSLLIFVLKHMASADEEMKLVFLILKLYGVWFVAWIVGCVVNTVYCYATASGFIFKGPNYGLDAKSNSIESVAFTLPVAVVTFPLIYAPTMFGLQWFLGGVKPSLLFLIVAATLYIIPTAYLTLSDESFHIIFLTAGALFGLAFVCYFS